MRILFLDDDPTRTAKFLRESIGHEVSTAETAQEAIDLLRSRSFDRVSLDHDLGGEVFVPSEHENTGYQVAKVVAEMPAPPPEVFIHSFNPAGAERMKNKIAGSIHLPFGTDAYWHMML